MLSPWRGLIRNKPDPPLNPQQLGALWSKVSALKDYKWTNQRLDDGCFIVFDTETTGLTAHRGDEIISLGAVAVIGNQLTTRRFCKLVNPYRDIPETVTLLTGITEEMTSSGEDLITVLNQFLSFVGVNPLVAHNSQFDLSFINLKLRKYFKQTLCIPVLDTFLIAQLLHPHKQSYCLDSLAKFYQVPLEGRHTSIGDSIITGQIFIAMMEELVSRGVKNMEELSGYLKFRRLY